MLNQLSKPMGRGEVYQKLWYIEAHYIDVPAFTILVLNKNAVSAGQVYYAFVFFLSIDVTASWLMKWD